MNRAWLKKHTGLVVVCVVGAVPCAIIIARGNWYGFAIAALLGWAAAIYDSR